MTIIFSGLKLKAATVTYVVMLLLLYAIAASQAVWSFSYKWTTIADHPEYSLEKTLAGEAPKPYAFRVLVPKGIDAATDLIPERVAGLLIERSWQALVASLGPTYAGMLNDRLALAYSISMISSFFFLLFTLILFRSIGKFFIGETRIAKVVLDFSPILFALLLTISYRTHNGFIYDYFELFVFALYLFLTKSRRLFLSLIVLALAIANKETAIFFPVFGAIIRWYEEQPPQPRTMVKIFFEFAVVAIGFVAIRVWLINHPGVTTEWHFFKNLDFWFSWRPWLGITSPHFALVPLPKPTNIIVLGSFLLVIFGYWKDKPLVIKTLLMVAGLINIPLFVLFCWQDEYRNLSLMFPFLYLSAVHTILYYFNNQAEENY